MLSTIERIYKLNNFEVDPNYEENRRRDLEKKKEEYEPIRKTNFDKILQAVQEDGLSLLDIMKYSYLWSSTNEHIDIICLAACQQNPRAIQYVPESRRTQEIRGLAISCYIDPDIKYISK